MNRRVYLSVMSAALLSGCWLFAVPADRSKEKGDSPKLELRISSEQKEFRMGEYPKIRAVITNRSEQEVTLVQPGDGSDCSWRTPVIGWSALPADSEKEHPKAPAKRSVARCGNINPLTAKEIIRLKPGESATLSPWLGYHNIASPGEYRLRFYYANRPGMKWQGLPLGKHDPDAMKAVDGSTKCELVSNEIVVTVKPKAEE